MRLLCAQYWRQQSKINNTALVGSFLTPDRIFMLALSKNDTLYPYFEYFNHRGWPKVIIITKPPLREEGGLGLVG